MVLKVPMASVLSVPGMPELNHSQLAAVKAVLQAPLSLIQARCVPSAVVTTFVSICCHHGQSACRFCCAYNVFADPGVLCVASMAEVTLLSS